jgi:CheY-like chemotaxis protein
MAPPTRATVLVVEDDRELREQYRLALVAAGYAVVAVEDGIDALRRIELRDPLPAAVVLDITLPRLSGHDVRRELAADPQTRHIPVVVVTGADTDTLNPDEFSCILQKPVSTERLVRSVDDCLLANRFRQRV